MSNTVDRIVYTWPQPSSLKRRIDIFYQVKKTMLTEKPLLRGETQLLMLKTLSIKLETEVH